MVNVHDKARELANALKDHETVVAYRNAAKKVKEDETRSKMVKDFHEIQYQAYLESQNEEISEETKKKMEQLVSIISLNPETAAFLTAEQKFSILIDDVMKIINEGIGTDIIG